MLEPRLCKEKGDADDEAGDCGKRSEGGRAKGRGVGSHFIFHLLSYVVECPVPMYLSYLVLYSFNFPSTGHRDVHVADFLLRSRSTGCVAYAGAVDLS